MTGASLRALMRALHLIGSALIGTFIYSPLSDVAWFAYLIQFGVIPLLSLSGIVMWQQGRIQRWLRPKRKVTG
jgi:hypothetical protein